MVAAVLGSTRLLAESPRWPSAEAPAWQDSPYHGAIDGDGRIIPCRCRFDGRDFRLGEVVCMATPSGNVQARCDLLLNNTSWVPTGSTCVTSRLDGGARHASRH
jgi:hypothetical protein